MAALRARRDLVRRFWLVIRSGGSVEDASLAAGVSVRRGYAWFSEAGGMPPVSLSVPARSLRLTFEEREAIAEGVAKNLSIRQIAAGIGRCPSTVHRELLRHCENRYRREYRPGARPKGFLAAEPRYRPSLAQKRADANAARPKTARLAGNDRLRIEVQDRLEEEHSPEQIARRLRVDFAEDPEMWVSHETIYQSLYVQGRGALRRDLTVRLRTGRALRRPRRRPAARPRRIPDMVHISERPAEVEDRAVPGHWEGDLITGTENKSAIGTLVERSTGFVLLLHLPTSHGAEAVAAAMTQAMSRLPETLRKTLTWDQGIEMRNHAEIAAATDLDIYFCDPHSPWQRGSNENTNGLLRQYFPKGTDLSPYAADYLEHVARKLNNRPRKRLSWKTPAETLDELLSTRSTPQVLR